MTVYVTDLEAEFDFLVLPSCQPVLSMGRMADADYEFSWRKMNGFKTMRIHQKDGAFVECFLRDCVPRLYNMTDAVSSQSNADSTVARKAYPDLSHVKQSCYPPIASKKTSISANAASRLPVISQPEEKDSESDAMPPIVDSSSGDEDLSRGPICSDTSDSDSDVPNIRACNSAQL